MFVQKHQDLFTKTSSCFNENIKTFLATSANVLVIGLAQGIFLTKKLKKTPEKSLSGGLLLFYLRRNFVSEELY